MEIKKSTKVSLENKRLLFAEAGLIVALAAVFGLLECRKGLLHLSAHLPFEVVANRQNLMVFDTPFATGEILYFCNRLNALIIKCL